MSLRKHCGRVTCADCFAGGTAFASTSAMPAWSTAKHSFCAVTSIIFTFWYLLTLLTCALVTYALSTKKKRDPNVRCTPEDRKLTFDLGYYVRLAGFELEEHLVTTEDGYILTMGRIVPRVSGDQPCYPVLLVPGLMQASAAYCTAGPSSIAFTLARAGFDVWLGNNRGGFHAQNMAKRGKWSTKTWEWSMRDLATIDVHTMINHVRSKTCAAKIAIVGHSQGTTQLFLGLSKHGRPDMGPLLSSFVALAPAVYGGQLLDRWFLRLLRRDKWIYHLLIGYRSFLGAMGRARSFVPLPAFTFLAHVMFRYMLGWNDNLWDRNYRDRNFIFCPVYVSSELMRWWLGKGGFAQRRCIFEDESEPWFDDRMPPMTLFTCGRDNLVPPTKLLERLESRELAVKYKVVELPLYSHLDVLWAADVDIKVAEPLMKRIWEEAHEPEKYSTPRIIPATSAPPSV